MVQFPPSELILLPDGSIFHLRLRPEQLADNVILVGDPGRVTSVASFFDEQECEVNNREFHSITGRYQGKRITVVSTGIGTDNCDIVLNELDALANIDLEQRTEKAEKRSLKIVRIGTSGGLQSYCPVGSYVVAEKSIGFDGLLHFYANSENYCDLAMEEAFMQHTQWGTRANRPYIVTADSALVDQIAQDDMIRGITIAANGFYGPQGRRLRLALTDPELNNKINSFDYQGAKITNFEMESSAIAGLASMMGHQATTICCIIANRLAHNANVNYQAAIEQLIKRVLERI